MFAVHLFGFDCNVYDIPNKPPYNLSGFGATSFQTIADHMEQQPHKVDGSIVFTDGLAPQAMLTHPKRWHWFITPNGTRQFVDKNAHVYMLEDFNWKG